MNSKKFFIPALVSLMTAGVSAQTSVINEMNINTDAFAYEGTSFYTSDIDSIVFYRGAWTYGTTGETYKLMKIYGSQPITKTVVFPVSRIDNIEFTFRDSRKLPAPKFAHTHIDTESKGNTVTVAWDMWDMSTPKEIKYLVSDHHYYSPEFFGNGEFELWLEGKHPYYNDKTMHPELPADGGVKIESKNGNFVVLEGLQYDTQYTFAIRSLSSEGEEFHSDWSSRTGIARNINFGVKTPARYNVPKILSKINRTEDYVRVCFNLSYDEHKTEDTNEDFSKNFEIVNDKFVADEIRIKGRNGAEVPAKWTKYKLTAEDLEKGYVDIDGLKGNGAEYICDIVNSNIESIPDSKYNTITLVKKEEFGLPVVIPHNPDLSTGEYNACRIDTVISNFMDYLAYDDGTFYLEGGKAYYIATNVILNKGITLETNPEDFAMGKRAKVYLGGITGSENPQYFLLGEAASYNNTEISKIAPITFRNIDFDCPKAVNYGLAQETLTSPTGNYFMNCLSTHAPFVLESLNITDCTFQGLIRGFVRLQGYNQTEISKVVCNGNLFYNCGYYHPTGSNYGFFTQPGTLNTNMYSDFRFSNNTIYDCPNSQLISDTNKSLAWDENTKWNITIENNTFINFSTRAHSRYLIALRYVPAGSHFSIQRNLFALAKNAEDTRTLYNSGADVRSCDGTFTFEIKDNYSTGCLDAHMKDDGIFTSAPFSVTKNSFGAFTNGNMGTTGDLKVKVGTTPLTTTDLFSNPNPPYNQVEGVFSGNDHKAPDTIMDALRYRQTPEVLNLEFYTMNIGDQRWK